MKKINYDLINKFQSGTATEAEKAEVLKWYRDVAERESEFPEDEQAVEQFMLQRLMAATHKEKKRSNAYYWVAAASLAAVFCVAGYYLSGKFIGNTSGNNLATNKQNDTNKQRVLLVLADGKEIDLSAQTIGNIPAQAGVKVNRTSGGEISYSSSTQTAGKAATNTSTSYNTIKTSAGKQFAVVLSDGTKVWLNAGSVFKFPVDLALGAERVVSLAGEGYFEVHRDKKHPFKVNSKDQVVEVLGTHFNVNAYQGDAVIRTTLLEGSVKVLSKAQQVKLRPGQEASFGQKIKVSDVNTANAVAWKNGQFKFEDERLETIMNAISRWYDVKVVYESENLKDETFGMLSDHNTDIATLLKPLAQTGDIKFRVSNRTVYISK